MSVRRRLASALNALLARMDVALVRRSQLERLRAFAPAEGFSFRRAPLPPEAERDLRPDNPRLRELRDRYRTFAAPVMARSVWTEEHASEISLPYFRGDNPFVWQVRQNVALQYVLTALYVRTHDPVGVLKAGEDDLFGIYTFAVDDGLIVSRDLLDSAVEISFLERALGLSAWSNVTVLDIGAGYGRLAHRLAQALPGLGNVLCTDAVAEATFLCEFYLRFRGVHPKAVAVPIDEIEDALTRRPVDIAVNVHSFSECPLEAVAWWLDLLRKYEVRYLMIVPNTDAACRGGAELRSLEGSGEKRDLQPLLHSKGYRLVLREPKYLDSGVQAHGISPTYHHLFERRP